MWTRRQRGILGLISGSLLFMVGITGLLRDDGANWWLLMWMLIAAAGLVVALHNTAEVTAGILKKELGGDRGERELG